jgi:hypothetical protein
VRALSALLCAAVSAIPLSVVYIRRARSEAHDFIITIISGGAPGRALFRLSRHDIFIAVNGLAKECALIIFHHRREKWY